MGLWTQWTSQLRNIDFNFIQSLAFTGLVVSLASQLGLLLLGKDVPLFWIVYIVWAAVFAAGTAQRIWGKPEEDDHHHH
jgi:hypothetical protein